ncbi:MAG: DUF494 family protein [Candidatus Kapabacteria bacterium]|nr:DUF494 family protein [Candidatus Kapabacteria bacterium]MBX7155050.1 DUF494 domain-containing protein [Bacteroidota bacterium]
MNVKLDGNTERIMEIIVHVISEMSTAGSVEDIDISHLQMQGYTEAEISIAVSWLVQQMQESPVPAEGKVLQQTSSTSFRTLHPAEQHLFSKEAHGELIQLLTLGIITNEHVESIIERCFMFGESGITKKDMYGIISDLIFRDNSLQAGSRTMLMGNDTIN